MGFSFSFFVLIIVVVMSRNDDGRCIPTVSHQNDKTWMSQGGFYRLWKRHYSELVAALILSR